MPAETYAIIAKEETDAVADMIRRGELRFDPLWVEECLMKRIRTRVTVYNESHSHDRKIMFKQTISEEYVVTLVDAALDSDPYQTREELLSEPGRLEAMCLGLNGNLLCSNLKNIRRKLEKPVAQT